MLQSPDRHNEGTTTWFLSRAVSNGSEAQASNWVPFLIFTEKTSSLLTVSGQPG
jgi:hypothetical protein